MNAIQVIDDFGIWDDLGDAFPRFEQWVQFPRYSTSLSPLVRLKFGGNLENIHSYAYLRSTYVIGNNQLKAPWVRVYPKYEFEYIQYPHPSEFGELKVTPRRYFEIQKRHYRRRFVGTHYDSLWSLTVQVCNERAQSDPFEEDEQLIVTNLIL